MNRTTMRRAFRVPGALLCCIAFASCKGDGNRGTAPPGTERSGVQSVSDDTAAIAGGEGATRAQVSAAVATVTTENFVETIDASGVVTPRVGRYAAMSAPAPSRVSSVHVAIGASVRRGDRLVSFEATGLDAAVAGTDAALGAALQAEARARRLVDAGVSPRKDFELAAAEAAAARAASVTARRAQQLATLRSPIDGLVTGLSAVLGANADIGQVLVEVADVRALDVQLVLSPDAANSVRVGQRIALRAGATIESPGVATGTVAAVAAALDSVTRGVVVRATISGQQRTLRLGEALYARITAATHRDAVVIPADALVPTGEGFQVFVVDSASVAHARVVTIGARGGERIWIRSGLQAGERIVTAGAYGIDDGAHVVQRGLSPP